MAGQVYTAGFLGIPGVAGDQLMGIVAPSYASVTILAIEMTQYNIGNPLAATFLTMYLARFSTPSSGGTTDHFKHDPASPASGTTVKSFPSTHASGVGESSPTLSFNTLGTLIYRPTPEERIRLAAGSSEELGLVTLSDGDSFPIRGFVTFMEH